MKLAASPKTADTAKTSKQNLNMKHIENVWQRRLGSNKNLEFLQKAGYKTILCPYISYLSATCKAKRGFSPWH